MTLLKLTRKTRTVLITASLFFALSAGFTTSNGAPVTDRSEIKSALNEFLVCDPSKPADTQLSHSPEMSRTLCLSTVYTKELDPPFWVDDKGVTEKGWTIIRFLKNSGVHGINPAKYDIDQIVKIAPSLEARDLALMDTLITYGLIQYIHDITRGLANPGKANPTIYTSQKENWFSPQWEVGKCLLTEDLISYLNSLAPQHAYYKRLQQALAVYTNLKKTGGWPAIQSGPTLKPGVTDPRIIKIKQRLLATDNLPDVTVQLDAVFNEKLKEMVVSFQKRHNLEADGVIGPATQAALNISIDNKIETIRYNMIRWHWMNHNLGSRHVMVNIPDYSLTAVENNKVVFDMPVVVGELKNQTPVFSDYVKYVVFNPYWTLTPSIAVKEKLPALRENPNHLAEKHIKLLSSWYDDAVEIDPLTIDWHQVTPEQMSYYRLRQEPGPWNSLGKVKFVFPNSYAVYMHDTQAQNLFSRTKRNLSHGCVRVSDPPALVDFFMVNKENRFTQDQAIALYTQDERKWVTLSTPIPVHLTYQTCWVDKNGIIHFNDDIYLRDEKLKEALYSQQVSF